MSNPNYPPAPDSNMKTQFFTSFGLARKYSTDKHGGRGGNRTHNIRLRRPVLYPIELLAQTLGTALLYRLVSFHSVDELRCVLMMTTGV